MLGCAAALVAAGCGSESDDSARLLKQKQRATAATSETSTPDQQLQDAKRYFEQGDYTRAIEGLRPLLQRDPENPEYLKFAARCEARSGNLDAAAELIGELKAIDPGVYYDGLWLLSQWFIDEGSLENARQTLEQMLEQRGGAVRVHRRMAKLLNNWGRRIDAAEHLETLARLGEITEQELCAMNTYSSPFFDASVSEADSPQASRSKLAEAKDMLARGQLTPCRKLIESLAADEPDDAAAAAFLGRVYSDLKDDDGLNRWYRTIPDGAESQPDYWQAMGMWLQRNGQHEQAVRCFLETVSIDQTNLPCYLAMTQSLQALGKGDEATRSLERFQRLDELQRLVKGIINEPGSREELSRVAELLEQLERPWEALGWRRVLIKTHGGTDSEKERLRRREEELRAVPPESDAGFATCGIDLDDWPLPNDVKLVTTRSIAAAETDSPSGRILFEDIASQAGLTFQYDSGDDPSDDENLLHQMTGGGIGVIDFDLDGNPDLYLTQGGGDAFDASGSEPNELFQNLGGERFRPVTSASRSTDLGYGQGVCVIDLNQDGFHDLVVANIGPNVILINNGDGTFRRDVIPTQGQGAWTTSIACGDLSGDHLPEIFVTNYVDDPRAMTVPCTPERDNCSPRGFLPAADAAWTLNAVGVVQPWEGCRDLASKPNYGFATIIADFDEVAGNDIYVANDTDYNQFWRSRRDEGDATNHLTECAQISGCGFGLHGQRAGAMGIAAGDLDRNGWLDLHVTNYWNQPSDLYLLRDDGLFYNANAKLGLFKSTLPMTGWGSQALDYDRDGWLDLPILNGHVTDHRRLGIAYRMMPQFFRGGPNGYQLLGPQSSPGEYWLRPTLGRAMASLDWNSDGKPDLAVGHLDIPLGLLENRGATGHHFEVELIGTRSERDAIGAKVTIECGAQTWTSWQLGGDGFICSNEAVIDFGIGSAESVDKVTVRWPSGESQTLSDLSADQRYLIVEGQSEFVRE